MKKREQDALRLRYIRALERFCNSTYSHLTKSKELTHKSYSDHVQKALKQLQKVPKAPLYKEFPKALEALAKQIEASLQKEDVEAIKQEILYASNRLQKSQAAKS